ncbi:MAG: hypothetical protein QF511_00740 [Rhodospirillales bacterium]|jgi:hypothetical protein|nr:hypothetical protein [Rhodospirillales bacterium]MDP7097053.1 hypothetical protein [Rhodospirillales bacterium]HIJ44185.1 hypothetical protein [Rhodospirillaceae bacterium]HIJ94041.1 hypothetical protein [Rhodospirillaceae bacterium]HJP53331.1 hypothetical protein [Rhodospirillales bacterium]
MTTNQTALDAFIARKAEIDEMLARIQGLSDDHFNVLPDDVHWGHVGDLAHYAKQLRRITDSAFQEGEHAE